MRRSTLVAGALLAAGSLAVAGTAYAAGPSHHDLNAKTVSVLRKDPAHDLRAFTMDDQFNLKRLPAPPAGALDVRQVTYRVVRTGAKPSLRTTVRFTGALPHRPGQFAALSGGSVKLAELVTRFGGTRWGLVWTSISGGGLNGLQKSSGGKPIHCAGITVDAQAGTHHITESLPLSCLAQVGIKAASLSTMLTYMDMSLSSPGSGAGSGSPAPTPTPTPTPTPSPGGDPFGGDSFGDDGSLAAQVAIDTTIASRVLPLTPLH